MAAKKKMMFWASFGLILVGLGGFAAYFFLFGRANPQLKKSGIKVGNATFSIEIASTTIEEARGLSFRASLDEGTGMLFLFGAPAIQRFWMKDMRFPLDVIWIGGNTVLGFVENAPPAARGTLLSRLPIYNSPAGTDKVLEVNAGTVAKDHIKIGDAVEFGI